MPGVAITYLIDPDTRTYQADRADRQAKRAADAPATVQDIRRALDDKNVDADLGRHAQPLACADHDLGLPGGQGRLRREAVQPQHPRRPDRRRGRPASTTGSSSTARRAAPSSDWAKAVAAIQSGKLGKLLVSRALVLQAARQHRRQAEHGSARASSISTSGSARRPSSPITATWSTTTGTGSGTSATATSATRACTRWTSPAG